MDVGKHATHLRFRESTAGGVFPFVHDSGGQLAVGGSRAALHTDAIGIGEATDPEFGFWFMP